MKDIHLVSNNWTRLQLEQETNRIYDICGGCRRCFNLCPSFNTLFDRIDDHENNISKFTNEDYAKIEKECYYCKLCYNHCPYTPPHQYKIDFPRLMVAWKKQRVREYGATWQDRLLIQTDVISKIGGMTASFTNWALSKTWLRGLIEKLVGLHRDRQVLLFSKESFPQWWAKRAPKNPSNSTQRKVVLFPSCMVNYQATDIGKATVQVLEKNKVEVVIPEGQRCCGMPSFDIGDTDTMVQTAQYHLNLFQPYLEQGYDLVVPTPSCSLMIKREYPYLVSTQEMSKLAEQTFDICEYLMRLKKNGTLSLEFTKTIQKIAYQVPCHLRDQNIGFKSEELMKLTGAHVELIEKCSGHDGSWGAKVEFFDISMKIAQKAVRPILNSKPDLVVSDCPLSALQLDQAGATPTKVEKKTKHPIQIIRDAYGLPS